MEIHLFTSSDIEQKLTAVENTLTVLNYALQGVRAEYGDTTLDSFDTIITDAKELLREVNSSLHPISLDWNAEKMMIISE